MGLMLISGETEVNLLWEGYLCRLRKTEVMISCPKLLRQFLTEAGIFPRFQKFTLYISFL